MKRDTVLMKPITSSFLSCEKDTETILRKLFLESKPYSNILKRLLLIQNKDCLNETLYQDVLKECSIVDLLENGYVFLTPAIKNSEHEKKKAYIHLFFDNFTRDYSNPEFRDCEVRIDIICHRDSYALNDLCLRPLKIAGYIDGILNNTKLSGIGTLLFKGCYSNNINEEFYGYTLIYEATHGRDDQIPNEDE